MGSLQILSYISILFFIVVVAARLVRISRMPVHLRWDLYPIPHEKGKSEYGGSYYEEIDWWTKPRSFSLYNELKEMGREIVFIQSLFQNNRSLWVFSFPFHFGMYCLIGFVLLLILGAILGAAGVEVSVARGGFSAIVYYLTPMIGAVGWILSIVGAFGLLLSRLLNRELRAATVFSDYVNLIFLLAVFVAGFVSWQTADPAYDILRNYMQSLITFRAAVVLPVAVAIQLWLVVALLFYFPFTHMTHMFGKYFTYHKVRWEDEPNRRGSKMEKSITESLGYKVSWSASHIKTGGTWADATAEEDGENG